MLSGDEVILVEQLNGIDIDKSQLELLNWLARIDRWRSWIAVKKHKYVLKFVYFIHTEITSKCHPVGQKDSAIWRKCM